MSKFTVKVTKKDVLLLYLLLIAVSLFVFIKYIYTPSMAHIDELDVDIADAEEDMLAMQSDIATLPMLRADNTKLKEKLAALLSEFYLPMQTWQLDDIFTELESSCGLEPVSLSVSSVDFSQGHIVEPYLYSTLYNDGVTVSPPDITVATVTLNASGTEAEGLAFIDLIMSMAPSLRFESYTLIDENNSTMSATVNVYMRLTQDLS